MSLYALPGLLPPISFNGSASGPSTTSSTRRADPGFSLAAFYLDSAVNSSQVPSNFQGIRDGSEDPAVEETLLQQKDRLGVSDHADHSSGGLLVASVVAIRGAKIDAARLIQALVLGNDKCKSSGASAGSAPRSRIRARPRPSASSATTRTDEDGDALPITVQEECMEFELTIRLESEAGCWSYETTRRLECFLELRRELVRELVFEDKCRGCCIPPVPRVQHDEASSWDGARGNSGGGFVFLQALLRSYVPVLEAWLRSVLERLPFAHPDESGALSDFLRRRSSDDDQHDGQSERREALSLSSRTPIQARKSPYTSVSPSQSNASFRPLDSIEESEEVEC